MSKTVHLRGVLQKDGASASKVAFGAGKLKLKHVVRLGTARDASGEVRLTDLQDEDVACVEFSDGFKLWLRVEDFVAEYGRLQPQRSGEGGADVWEIDPRISDEAAARGFGGLVIETLALFGVDVVGKTATELAKWWEEKQLGRSPGIYRCSFAVPFKLQPLETPMAPAAAEADALGDAASEQPFLLLLHGTMSSAEGSFGKLWATDNPQATAAREALDRRYGDRVYAYEHRSLTVSPIDNALDLVARLPDGAEVHLLTHSRGGLVGELLCLGQRDIKSDPLKPETLDQIFDEKQNRSAAEVRGEQAPTAKGYSEQRARLDQLLALVDRKRLKIRRFVRVACPARGTTLASGRLDRWLSVFHYLAAESLVGDAVDFLLAVVKERTDPRSLPGLEAQMPRSALVQLLNHVGLAVGSDLTVIAGDVEGKSLLGRLKWLIADWFYDSDHDLVVNTGSMYGGARRDVGNARFLLDQGDTISHFQYFRNGKTIRGVVDGLTRADDANAGFQPLEVAKQEEPAWRAAVARSAQQGPRPVVLVLPGTLGSQLAVQADRIWLDYFDLAFGRLFELGIGAPGVRPLDLIDDYYGKLLEYLSRSHEVVPFAYDWRKSILVSADQLAEVIKPQLAACEKTRQPFRIVAHSMGGLVARAMLARHPALWKRIKALKGSRLLMLGTPNAGSYEAVRWLTGWNPTLDKLALLDVTHNTREIVKLVGAYPGLLELLPFDTGGRDFADRGLWQQLCREVKEWPVPADGDLGAVAKTWDLIRNAPVDSECMLYVAGWAPQTVCDYEEPASRGLFSVERPRIRFFATSRGDGTVTWAAGLLPGVKTWYVENAVHDQLPSCEEAFRGYLELLITGNTELLPATPPARSRAAYGEDRVPMPEQVPDSIPAEGDLTGFVFGAAKFHPQGKSARKAPRVRISLCHGDLAYARHPVCIGHYQGDTIVSAEAALDSRLDGALTRRARVGLYPGELGSQEVFIQRHPTLKPGGAIIVGLGRVGELSPGSLEGGIAHAMLEYALTVMDWPDERFGGKDAPRSAAVSVLLIGTGAGGMTPRDSMEAILRAVRTANQRLVDSQFDDKVLIDRIQLLELFQDVAAQAAQALEDVLLDGELCQSFEWPQQVIEEGQGGRRRIAFEEAPHWWHRMEITRDKKRDELRFIALTDRARAEESLVAGQMRLADDFIDAITSNTENSTAISRTLFEMLLPNRIKELAPNQYDVVLLLDEVSARYPWELLENRWGREQPIAVASGMLRQLKTQNFRSKPLHTFARTAYVVGNPRLSDDFSGSRFADLPGAAREAEAVASLLQQSGYGVNEKQVALEASDILIGLHKDAYRILHLAGHGVHDYTVQEDAGTDGFCPTCEQSVPGRKKQVSGMVIGKDIFLTPGDVAQMRWVPELVFINCCYLGATGGAEAVPYNRLAANLATQFIDMGVKAVVAAGWAVDDAAARDFALSFYGHLLAGATFGDAVRAAREVAHTQHRQVNTWGAYQCYGDPAFRLETGTASRQATKRPYHSTSEAVADLEGLASSIRMSAGQAGDVPFGDSELEAIIARIPEARRSAWLAQADIAAARGRVFGELEAFGQAVECLDTAIAANKAAFPVTMLEQRANFLVRDAWQQWRAPASGGTAPAREKAVAQIDRAIKDLSALMAFAPTAERHCLIASAFKRLAGLTEDNAALRAALIKAADHYHAAFEMTPGRDDAYPLTNWLDSEIILAWLDVDRDQSWRSTAAAWCDAAVKASAGREESTPEFWNSVVTADCYLFRGLLDGSFAKDGSQRIVAGYHGALARGAGPREQRSVLDHLDFLLAMADRAGKQKLRNELRAIRRQL